MPSLPLVVFRADADPRIGGGHIMRCLTLAAAFQRMGWRCVFAATAGSAATVPALAKSGHATVEVVGEPMADAHRLRQHAGRKIDLLVIDHPVWTAVEETHLRAAAEVSMAIDGLGRRHATDIWLDPNPGHALHDLRQLATPGCDILHGLEFAPIAPAIAEARERSLAHRRDRVGRLDTILVNFGAGDQIAALETALRGIAESGQNPRITVVAGNDVARYRTLAAELRLDCEVLPWSDRLGDLMAQADLMIGAAGTSAWERCCLGLPSIVITVAENQVETARFLGNQGAATDLGPIASLKPQKIANALSGLAQKPGDLLQMSAAASRLVDGAGAERVVAAVERHRARVGPEPAA